MQMVPPETPGYDGFDNLKWYHVYDIIATNRGIFGYQQNIQDTRII
jgi:hypothetical protein